MTSIKDDDLILYLLDQLDGTEKETIKDALANDSAIADRLAILSSTLESANAWEYKADSELEQRVWNQVEANLAAPSLQSSDPSFKRTSIIQSIAHWLHQPTFVFAAIAVAITLAFVAGRQLEQQQILNNPEQLLASLDEQARDNILLQSVALHFASTSRLMTSVSVNIQSELINDEQQWADRLLTSNRIFKVAAKQAQQWRIVTLLEEIEPLLIEMANADDNQLTSRNQLQQRIDNNRLVFKTKHFSKTTKPAI